MKKTILFYRKALFIKIALLAALIVGGGNSAWSQKELTYEFGFEVSDNAELETEGWTMVDAEVSSSYSYTGINSGTYYTGNKCFRFIKRVSGNLPQYLISPKFANSPTGIEVSFYYRAYSNSYSESFKVGYTTEESPTLSDYIWDDISTIVSDADWHEYSNVFVPSEGKNITYIAIQHEATGNKRFYFYVDDFHAEAFIPYKEPQNFALTSSTHNSATFNWKSRSFETNWQLVYSTDENFDPDETPAINVTTNPFILNGLEGTTYYAYIRTLYLTDDDNDGNNEEHLSSWSNKVTFMPGSLLLNDGNTSNQYVIIDNSTNKGSVKSQFIIPSNRIESIQSEDKRITQLIFYSTQNSISWTNATFNVFMKMEPELSYYASSTPTFIESCDEVCSNTQFSVIDGKLVINLDEPFAYTSGNLIIGIEEIGTTSASVSSTWYGKNESSSSNRTSAYAYLNYNNNLVSYGTNFSPKVTIVSLPPAVSATIGSTGYTTFCSARPLNLSSLPNNLKAYYIVSDGVDEDVVRLTEATGNVPSNTGLILKGTPGQTYNIPVVASGSSLIGNLLVGCTTPKALAASANDYVLVKNSSTGQAEFQSLADNGATIPALKAFLRLPESSARSLRIVFEDEMTGIRSMNSEPCTTNSAVFDLQGRRVANGQLMKGLYIQNGKKMILK